jgi:hypothetical protein
VRGGTVSASNSTVYTPSNATTNVSGSGDAIVAGGNSTITATGSAITLNASGANDVVNIGGNGEWATNANDETLNFAQGGVVNEATNSRADTYGSGVTASLASYDTFGLYGSADTVNAPGPGDEIWIGENGQSATGSNIDAMNFSQSGGYVFEMAGTNLNVAGNGETIAMTWNDTLNTSGSSEGFQFGTETGSDVVNGFSSTDSMQFSKTNFASWTALLAATKQSGSNTVITLDAADTVTLTGVAKSSLVSSEFSFV